MDKHVLSNKTPRLWTARFVNGCAFSWQEIQLHTMAVFVFGLWTWGRSESKRPCSAEVKRWSVMQAKDQIKSWNERWIPSIIPFQLCVQGFFPVVQLCALVAGLEKLEGLPGKIAKEVAFKCKMWISLANINSDSFAVDEKVASKWCSMGTS